MTGIGRQRPATLRGDLTGGIVSAALAVPLAMGYGMFAFGPLGNDYFAYGALSGLYAAAIAGFVCVALGDRTTTIYVPRITTTFFLGALLYYLIAANAEIVDGGGLHLIFIAFFAIILLGGAFQAVFGLIGLGSLLRYTPHPVMAGIQNAAAALLFLVQLGNICGFDRTVPFTEFATHATDIKPLSLLIAAITFVVMWNTRMITTKAPPLLVGLGIGSALYFAVIALGFGAYVGPVIGLPGDVKSPAPVNYVDGITRLGSFTELLPIIVGGALALAIVAALDALLCAKLAAPTGAQRVDGNKLLFRLGASNMLSACVGGITSGINIGPSATNRDFGAKTALSVLINAVVLLLVVFALFPVVSHLPRSVLSATIMVIAVQHIDPWSIDLFRRIRKSASPHRRLMLLDLTVIVLVAILSVTVNIVLAVFIGILIAIALFVVRMSRSSIRRIYRGDTAHSRKARSREQNALLEKQGAAIVILELQGVLFFGSAETLRKEIERNATSATRSFILDLRRVTDIDATGTRILSEIHLSLGQNNQNLVLARAENSELAIRLAEVGVVEDIGSDHVFSDVDRAMEWAEDDLLRGSIGETESDALPLAALSLCADMTAAEVERFSNYLRVASFTAGEVVFREGDHSKELFIVTTGRASARLNQPTGGDIRLATFSPGTVFGELTVLDAGPRSATVIADEDMCCYVLGADKFAELVSDAPAIAIRLLKNLGHELSARLRRANRTIHQLES